MKYSEFKKLFNFELPSYAADLYEDFVSCYDGSAALSEEDALLVAEQTELPDEGKESLVECARIINENEISRLCAAFIIYITVTRRDPWVNHIYTDDLFNVDGIKKEQVNWVIVAAALANTLKNKKPPKDLNAENLNAFRGYSRSCLEKYGYWGILEWNWNMLCAGGCMFLFGILKFVPGVFGDDFKVITNGKEYVSLACGEYNADKNGALTNDASVSVFKTSFTENESGYIGNRISARGVTECTVTDFPKPQWHDFLTSGTYTLNIHIPSGIEYTPEKIKEACRMALAFYKEFYPQINPAAIVGYSWIFAPELERVMPKESNIMRVNRSAHIIPTLGEYGAECRFLRNGSGLQQRIKEQTEKGVRFHYGIMYIPVDEIETLGKETE